MRFVTPILQGVIVLLVVGIFGWGVQAYGKLEVFDLRLKAIETQAKVWSAELKRLNDRTGAAPLCQR